LASSSSTSLLDEPGLSLHGLAQADLLRYVDHLAEDHQILYTTHSPFMVHGDRLHQVRLVEDRDAEGPRITDDVTGSDPATVFPLQAALGYTLAQNLFISKRNLLVEGPADLVYLQFFSGSSLFQVGRLWNSSFPARR
jgi:predicted ATP-dependent endonuclease of OLD family